MAELKILMSNIGYARGLGGALSQHILYAHRHFYCSPSVQKNVMSEIGKLIAVAQPDICCLLEIEAGAPGAFSQLHTLLDAHYRFHDIANKYAEGGRLSRMPVTASKSNAFFANRELAYERLYLKSGAKRLVYKLMLTPGITLFFAHFSLRRATRQRQFSELCHLLKQTPGEHIVMGDFNILTGMAELQPLLENTGLSLMNDPQKTTFRFHRSRKLLDLCLCSPQLKEKLKLEIIPQHFSDHDALLVSLRE